MFTLVKIGAHGQKESLVVFTREVENNYFVGHQFRVKCLLFRKYGKSQLGFMTSCCGSFGNVFATR